MEDQLISFETAKLAKEKGFSQHVEYYWNTDKNPYITHGFEYQSDLYTKANWNNGQGSYPTLPEKVCCSAPTQSLLQRWLREVHKLHINIVYEAGFWKYIIYILPSDEDTEFAASGECQDGDLWLDAEIVNNKWYLQEYISYEQALEEGLFEALKLIKTSLSSNCIKN